MPAQGQSASRVGSRSRRRGQIAIDRIVALRSSVLPQLDEEGVKITDMELLKLVQFEARAANRRARDPRGVSGSEFCIYVLFWVGQPCGRGANAEDRRNFV